MLRYGKKVCVVVAGVASIGYFLYWICKIITFHLACSARCCRMIREKSITGKKQQERKLKVVEKMFTKSRLR